MKTFIFHDALEVFSLALIQYIKMGAERFMTVLQSANRGQQNIKQINLDKPSDEPWGVKVSCC